jgi:hypothetical protein
MDKNFHGLIVVGMSDKTGAFSLHFSAIIQVIDRLSDDLVAVRKMIGDA